MTDESSRNFRGTIYYIGAFAFPQKNASTQRVRSNAKIFRDLGYRVVLIGTHDGGTRGIESRGSFVRDGFHCLSLNMGKGRLQKAMRRLSALALLRILRMRFAAPAVICYNHLAISQAQIQAYCRLNAIPFAPDATEWYGPGSGFILDVMRRIDTTTRMRFLNRRASGIITTSPYLTRFYSAQRTPMVELPTLFDQEETGTGTASESGPLSLIFAGNPFNPNRPRLQPKYWKERLDWVIEIVAQTNRDKVRATLDIYGVTKERYLASYEEAGANVDADWLRFWGPVPREQVLEATKAADFTVYFREPTRTNRAGFPSKFSESITCGTPVITNPMENITPVARDGFNVLFVDPTKLGEGAARLRALADDRGKIAEMKRNCATARTFDYRSWIEPVDRFVQRWMPGEAQ
jgi:glycosyltransferase involved in cell wall biosynthesis